MEKIWSWLTKIFDKIWYYIVLAFGAIGSFLEKLELQKEMKVFYALSILLVLLAILKLLFKGVVKKINNRRKKKIELPETIGEKVLGLANDPEGTAQQIIDKTKLIRKESKTMGAKIKEFFKKIWANKNTLTSILLECVKLFTIIFVGCKLCLLPWLERGATQVEATEQVQLFDEAGEALLDEEGNPVYETRLVYEQVLVIGEDGEPVLNEAGEPVYEDKVVMVYEPSFGAWCAEHETLILVICAVIGLADVILEVRCIVGKEGFETLDEFYARLAEKRREKEAKLSKEARLEYAKQLKVFKDGFNELAGKIKIASDTLETLRIKIAAGLATDEERVHYHTVETDIANLNTAKASYEAKIVEVEKILAK